MIKKKGFTLAEVMIVFTVIGVLTAILIPTLFAASPDQQKLKAKKAYNTLTRAVENLVNSSTYGNTGLLESTPFILGAEDADTNARNRFFCNQLTEVLNVKKADCTLDTLNTTSMADYTCKTGAFAKDANGRKSLCMEADSTGKLDYASLQSKIDTICLKYFSDAKNTSGYNFTTADNVLWGVQLTNFTHSATVTSDGITSSAFYNLVCFDTSEHQDSSYMYGAGVRKDGKIVVGKKLQELLEEEEDLAE